MATASVAAVILFAALASLRAQSTAGSPPASSPSGTTRDDEEPPTGQSGPAMSRLTVTQRRMAALMQQANDALKAGTPPAEAAKTFYAGLAAIEGLKAPMVALNDLKTRLTGLGLADTVLGEKFPLGGTPVERALLVYRRDLTMDCIRSAVAEVAARFGADATGKVFLAKIGKWAVQNPDMFMLAGDIDFSFVGARPEVILALRDAFAATIRERSGGLDMVAIDSVATAHGFAEHMVYMGIQGRKFADDAMAGMDTGVEQIDFHAPDSVGTSRARQLTGKQALVETVLEETGRRYREEGHEAKGRSLATETEKAWNDRRSQTVEPMLSMEMARHLDHDIIANMSVFSALDLVKKGSKYLRRSNDQLGTDLGLDSASPDWARFVEAVDEKAKKASAEALSTFIYEELQKMGMDGLFELKVEKGKPATLEANPGGAEAFLATVKAQIWKNVSSGLDLRIRTMTDLVNLRGRAAGPGTPDDLRPDRLQDTIRMIAAGLDAMQHDHGHIPPDIVTKVSILTKLVEAHARRLAFALPEQEMQKIREVLREATASENSLLLHAAAVADHVDKWMVRHYDTLAAKLPPRFRPAVALADAKIDALNNLLDTLDNHTVAALRERGIVKAPIPVGLSEDGTVQFLKVAEFPSIGAINARLNQSVLGKIGNSTAFKAFNLAQEADAYYAALTQAATPSEAFQNLAVEIFRRRVPGGGAVEALVMENYLRASVEVVYLLFPPAAVPEGLYGIAVSVYDKYDSWWWSSELERCVDTFYAGAEFELVPPKSPDEKRRFRLTAITITHASGWARYPRAEIEGGTAAFLRDPAVDKALWQNIAATDPFIQLMEELKKHQAAGEKVRARFQQQQNEHWAKLKADFGKALVERFENRKASETAIDLGEVPVLYGELIEIADALEIKQPLHAAMDAEWDSDYLRRLWVWLTAEKREAFGEAPPEAEKTRAVTILRKYLEAFRKVRDARAATESALASIFTDAGLAPLPAERDNRRILTGIAFLRCVPDTDTALAARLRTAPAATLERVRAQLDAIIEAKAPGAARDDEFDRAIAAKITGETFWIAALRATQVPVIGAGALDRAIAAHSAAADALVAEFTEHYLGKAGALAIRVRQWIDGGPSRQPVTGASIALLGPSGQPAGSPFRETADGTYLALAISDGRYTATVAAPGFTATSGEPKAAVALALGATKGSREVEVFLAPAGATDGLGVTITASIAPVVLFTRGQTTSVDLRATVAVKKDSGKLAYQWSLGEEVLSEPPGQPALALSAVSRPPGDHILRLFVADEKSREGTAEIPVRIVDGEPLAVAFADHRPEIFKDDQETLSVAEPRGGPGSGFNYRWTFADADGNRIWAQDGDDLDRQLVAGRNYAGATLTVTVAVRDRDGRSGSASTTLVVRDEDKPPNLAVALDPASGRLAVGQSLTLHASATGFPDSGKIQYSWDDGKTWSDQASGEITAEPDEAGITLSIVVMARDTKGRMGGTAAAIAVYEPEPDPASLPPLGLRLEPGKPLHRIGDTVYLNVTYDYGRVVRRWEWTPSRLGDRPWGVSFPATEPGTTECQIAAYETFNGVERLVEKASCRVVVLGPTTIKAPATAVAGDILQASVTMPPEIAAQVKHIGWSAGAILGDKSFGEQDSSVQLQFNNGHISTSEQDGKPVDLPCTISVCLMDEEGRQIDSATTEVAVRRVGLSASGADVWQGGPHPKGLHLERKPAKRMRTEDGKDIVSATVTGTIDAKWGDWFVPETMDELKKQVEEAAIWGALPSSTGAENYQIVVEPFAIGDHRGFIKRTTGVARRYNGSPYGYVDVCYPQTGASGCAMVMKGRSFITVSYSTSGGGIGLGAGKLWWDDMPFCRQHTEAALSEIQGILGSLAIQPDPSVRLVPYAGPKLDGSDAPVPLAVGLTGPAKLVAGELGTVTAAATGGKPPYAYAWEGDHAGKGESVTIVSRTEGDTKISVTVTDAEGQTATAALAVPVEAVNPAIQGLPASPVYGSRATPSVTLPAGGSWRVVWQSEPRLAFDPVESSGSTTVVFDRCPSGGVKVWAEIHRENDGSWITVGESPQVVVAVVPPKFKLEIAEPAPKVGREVAVRIVAEPAPDPAAPIDYRWLEPATAQRRETAGDASAVAITVREASPLALVVHARVPGSGDELGEIRGKIEPVAYRLDARVVEPGTRPMIWKEGVGLVPVERGTYAGDENVGLAADFVGGTPEGEVRWSWTANEGTTLSNPASRTPTASRHETGTASLAVAARDKNGVVLGQTSVSFSVTVPAAEVQKALQPVVTLRADKSAPVTNEPLVFTAEATRGTAPYRFAWTGASSATTTATITPAKPGKVSISVTVTDAKGKTATASLEREVSWSERDRARQEAERLAAAARDAARRGDFDAAVKAIEDARRADPPGSAAVEDAAREAATAAKTAARAAEAKRDFATSAACFGAAAKLDSRDAEATRGAAAAQAFARKLEELRAAQKELEGVLAGTTSPETTALASKVQSAVAEYTRAVAAQKRAVEADKSAKRYKEARAKLASLSQERPLRRDDAAWAKTLLAELDGLIAAEAAKKPDRPEDKKPGDSGSAPAAPDGQPAPSPAAADSASAGSPSAGNSGAAQPGPAGGSSAGRPTPADGSGSAAASPGAAPGATSAGAGASASRPLPPAAIGTTWDKLQAVGGDFGRFTRFDGGTLVVDVPAGNSWGKTGIVTREPAFTVGSQPASVTVRLDPARTTGFCVAFAPRAHQDVWLIQNVWLTWTRPEGAARADVYFGNTQDGRDGTVSAPLPAAPPAELVFTFEAGRASVRLPDGTTHSIAVAWLEPGTPVFAHVFSHPAAAGLPAKVAVTGIAVGDAAPPPSIDPPPGPAMIGTSVFSGALDQTWAKIQAAGGNFDAFARFDRGSLVVDVPEDNSWGKTGIVSREPTFTLGARPTSVIVRLDPARTTGFCAAFAPSPNADVWTIQNVWLTWTRPASAVQADLSFANTQNAGDGRLTELLPPTAPAELVFTFQPGRADVLLPDGRTRSIAIAWLREGTPVFTHVFTHAAEPHRPAKLALAGVEVADGAPVPPTPRTVIPRPVRLDVSDLGSVWAKLQAAGGNFDAFARFADGSLVVDVPAANSWAKTGLYSRERTFTIGDQPMTVIVRLDPARTTGFCVAFAPSPNADVWTIQNAWFSWTRPSNAVQAAIGFCNTQNAADGRLSELLAPTPPAELVFTLQPGRADVRLPDGKTRSIPLGWLAKGTPVFTHVFTHAAEPHRAAKLALAGIDVLWGPAPAPTAPPAILDRASVDLPVGEFGEVWDKLQAAGGNFDAFARFDRGALVVDVPAGNHWAKTGLLTRERLAALSDGPVHVTVRLDPARTTGFCVAFAPSPNADVWIIQNVWLSWTRTAAAAQAGIGFANTQNPGDGSLSELLAPAAPAELLFTLEPGRASVRLPDGRTRSIAVAWLKRDTPIFAHVFTHAAAPHRPAKLALTGFSVSWGTGAPPAGDPVALDRASTALPVGDLGKIWAKLQAAGGNFDRFARFDRGALVVDVPPDNFWTKTGLFSPDPLFTVGRQPVRVSVALDPARTTGFCVAFAPSPNADVWTIQNAWFGWTVPLGAKEADLAFLDTQNAGDGRVTEKLPLSPPRELVFTLQPGRVDVRLPDGKTRSIAIGWLKEGTPVYGHIFSHPAAVHLPAKLALTGVTVSFGPP
jgi:hypothetical protein